MPEVPPRLSVSGGVIYREDFASGPGAWSVGKDREDGSWHRNIYRQRGNPDPLGWSRREDGRGGFAFSEAPWYFDDNHGELFWLYLAFFINRSSLIGIEGKDLRSAAIRLMMRGRAFRAAGTQLVFWVQGLGGADTLYEKPAYYNWALTTQPAGGRLETGEWHEAGVTLAPDENAWRQMGLLNGGLARRLRVIQSTSAAEGTLDGILGGKHINFGFVLGGVDPNDPPDGRIELAEIVIQTG